MTPDRNTRRHTLRSVQSSPGRSFLISKSMSVFVLEMSARWEGRACVQELASKQPLSLNNLCLLSWGEGGAQAWRRLGSEAKNVFHQLQHKMFSSSGLSKADISQNWRSTLSGFPTGQKFWIVADYFFGRHMAIKNIIHRDWHARSSHWADISGWLIVGDYDQNAFPSQQHQRLA